MILTADSGSTKCHWALVEGEGASDNPKIIETRGINPVTCSPEQVKEIIAEGLLPQSKATEVEGIYFYGAGCIANAPATLELQRTLQDIFSEATTVVVATDMLGAAHALCGHNKGIVCILGTGSNSAFYDGEQLTKNVPPLGYILGDEGGGANLGKTFVSDALKGLMPQEIVDLKKKYPNAKVLIHPECTEKVLALGDFIGSTTQIIQYIKENEYSSYIIVTEKGVVDRLQRDYPEKEFILVSQKAYCPNMKRNYLEDVLRALENEEHEIFVDAEIAKKALIPIERMVNINK